MLAYCSTANAISSTIIEHMKEHCKKPGIALAYFYFDFNDPEKQKISNLVSCLLAQLCNKLDDLPDQLKVLYKGCSEGQHRASVHDLKVILPLVVKDIEDVFIVIDGLDECAKIGERGELLTLVEEIHAWSLSKLHLLVTSRPEPDIKSLLAPLVESQAISIQGSQVDSDINLHIRSQLSTDPKLKKWPNDVKVEIENALTARANGM
jgi:ankyrin repeat domain-containing protein 50